MNLIDADKFLSYLIFQKHIDSLTCGEIKEAVEMCKIDVLEKIRTEIEEQVLERLSDGGDDWFAAEKVNECLEIIDKYKAESEG